MKILILLCCCCPLVFGGDDTPDLRRDIVVSDKDKKNFLYRDKMKKYFDECSEEFIYEKEYEKWEKCFRDKIGSKKQFKQLVESIKPLESTAISVAQVQDNRVIKKLQDYLFDRLKEALYGVVKDKKGNIISDRKKERYVKHGDFLKLYKTQIGKSLLATITAYCSEARKDECFSISVHAAKRVQTSQDNLELLKQHDSQGKSQAYAMWEDCMQKIPEICYQDKTKACENAITEPDKDDYAYSKERACVVQNNIDSFKRTLMAVADQEEYYKKVIKSDGVAAFQSDRKVYSGKGGEKSFDSLTSLTSNEVYNESGVATELSEIEKKIEAECPIVNNSTRKECQKYLSSKEQTTLAKDIVAEEKIRLMLMKNRLADMSEEETRQYLKNEGRDADKLLKKYKFSIDEIKAKIKLKYEAERKGTIAAKVRLLERQEVKPQESIEQRIKKIQQHMRNKVENWKMATHWMNVVSGYLQVATLNDSSGPSSNGQKKKTTMRGNWNVSKAELKDSAYASAAYANKRKPAASAIKQHLSEDVTKAMKKAGVLKNLSEKTDVDNPTIEVDTINESINPFWIEATP